MTSATRVRIDWRLVRDSIDLIEVITRDLGTAPRRSGRFSLWCCPFHDDRNPSLKVDPARQRWKCYPCNLGGDVVEFVRRRNPGWTFAETVAHLTSKPLPSGGYCKAHKPRKPAATGAAMASKSAKTASPPPERPAGLPMTDAMALVRDATERLWAPEGTEALVYLRGRGLADETIRTARLGWTPRADGVAWKPPGLVIRWHDGDRLALVKVRVPDEWRERFPEDRRPPKYIEAYRDRPTLFPGPEAIRPGRPLIIVEGEFDAL